VPDTLACVVTGATGAVGPAVANRIAREAGATVVALARHAPPPGLLLPQVRFESHDVLGDAALRCVKDADCVFHLAARLHTNDPAAARRDEYERVNVEGTRRLVDAVRPSARLVFFSTIDVYGPTPAGTQATESTLPNPGSIYGDTKLRAEQFVLEHPGGLVLRLAAVYGPTMKANYARLVHALARHRYVQMGPGTNHRTLIFEQDVAQAAWLAAGPDDLPSRIYNLTDGGLHTVNDIVSAISAALGRRPPRWSLPAPPVRTAAAALDALCRAAGRRSPVTPQMVDKLQANVAVSGRRFLEETTFRPGWDLVRGWTAAVREMRAVS
jgi:nucleoside-diphosphate-sugar epimerase